MFFIDFFFNHYLMILIVSRNHQANQNEELVTPQYDYCKKKKNEEAYVLDLISI